jgi:hypothetical protein
MWKIFELERYRDRFSFIPLSTFIPRFPKVSGLMDFGPRMVGEVFTCAEGSPRVPALRLEGH